MINFAKKYFFPLIESFDFFGRPVQLYVKKDRFLQSFFGGIISLLIIILSIVFLVYLLLQWNNLDKVKIVQSTDLKTSYELLAENKYYTFELNCNTYYPKFAMYLNFFNATILSFKDIAQFFTLSAKRTDVFGNSINLETESCKNTREKDFLKKEFPLDKDEEDDQAYYQCLKNPANVSLTPNQTMKTALIEYIEFSVNTCQNSSKNNNSCASLDEINKYAKYLLLDVWVPKTNYDFRNIKEPRKRAYDIYYYVLDPELSKLISINIVPTHLYKDKGLFFEDYEEGEIYFDIEHFHFDSVTRKITDGNDLFKIDFILSGGEKSYYLVNYKWNDILGNLGGTLNIMLLAGQFFCGFYNYLLIKHLVATYTFSFPKKEDEENKKKGLSKFHLLRHFNFFKKQTINNKIYSMALDNLHEYLDISKIIKRLQDIDKLKLILFNDYQRELFESIPKPTFLTEFGDFKFLKKKLPSLKGYLIKFLVI